MAPPLILTLADDPAIKWTLRDGVMTVGRASSCDIAVQHPSVSRVHARLTVGATGCRVSDLTSSNGTFVNGIRITGDADVRDGDAIAFGEVNIKVTAPPPPKPAPAPAPFTDPGGRGALDVTLLEQPGTLFWRVDAKESPVSGIRARDPHRLINLLSEAAKALMLHGSLNDILGRVVDLAVEHLSAERAVLMLTDEGGNLTVQVQRPDPAAGAGRPLSASSSLGSQSQSAVTPGSQSAATPATGGIRASDVFALAGRTSPLAAAVKTDAGITGGAASAGVAANAGAAANVNVQANAGVQTNAGIQANAGVQASGPSAMGPLPISRTVAHRVMTERVAFLAEDVAQHDMLHQAESVIMRRVQSLMCAPLWHEQRVSGVLYLEDGVQHKFNAADLEILVSLSNYAAVAIERSLLADRLLAEQRNRERLERYHSPAVVDRISAQTIDGAFEAQERQVTVLFADLVGFTSIAETMPASEVAGLLNDFFADMTEVIFAHDGTLDKFMGDGLLAVFGAPLPQVDHAARAVAAAIEMQRRLRRRGARGTHPALTMRIGLSSGPVVAGDIGSPKRREYTVLGDTVNTAARLESSVAQPGQIVLTRVTLDRVVDTVSARSLGMIELRGRRQAVEVFAIVDDE